MNRSYFIERIQELEFKKYDPKTTISTLLKSEYYNLGEFRVVFGEKKKKVLVRVSPTMQELTLCHSWSTGLALIKQILKDNEE